MEHLAPVDAGAGAHVDDMVGGADGVFVMLDHQHGVAEGFQALEGFEEAVVVLLVEADRGFVEDVEDAAEAAADLGGEADALAFAAGQGARRAVEVEIVEPDVVEEAEALVDLLQDRAGDFLVLGGQFGFERAEPGVGFLDAAADGDGDVLAGDLHRAGFGLEAGAVAGLAGVGGLVAGELLLHPGGFRSGARRRLRLPMTPSNAFLTS